MWEPQRLIALWAFTARYSDSFAFCLHQVHPIHFPALVLRPIFCKTSFHPWNDIWHCHVDYVQSIVHIHMFSDPMVHWTFRLSVRYNAKEVHVTIYHGRDVIDHTLQSSHPRLASLQYLHGPPVFNGKALSLRDLQPLTTLVSLRARGTPR
jgi:hypothetical protein